MHHLFWEAFTCVQCEFFSSPHPCVYTLFAFRVLCVYAKNVELVFDYHLLQSFEFSYVAMTTLVFET